MKKIFNSALMVAMAASSAIFSSCSDDGLETPTEYYKVIDFENSGLTLAGPTSYGANLYSNYAGEKFTSGTIAVEDGVSFEFGINPTGQWSQTTEFSNGGMALSQWNYRSNIDGVATNWWMTYENQCSVYNTASADQSNRGAGADGSDTFVVLNGCNLDRASFNFSNGTEYVVSEMMICPPSYLYGALAYGNPFGTEPDKTIEEANGWFKILAYGYDAQGRPTNGGMPVEKYICDYRTNTPVELFSTWQKWDVSALGKVNKVEFDFEGSDMNNYGYLCTPTYMCVDNITIRLN